jgi:DNA-binding MurR/RpiR family transcriptional regulator
MLLSVSAQVASATGGAATGRFAERVAARSRELSPAERHVAEQLVGLGPQAVLLSAAAIADRLGTSDATVVRTAKSLGYAGLAELRQALASAPDDPDLDERLRRTLAQVPEDELFATTIRNHLAAVEALTYNVSREQFNDAVAILADAERIVWRGVGPSAHLAEYAQLIAQRVGKPSTALVHTGTSFADELLSIRPSDGVVVFAYGRMQPHVRVLVDHAATLDVPVVLITDGDGRKLEDATRVTLRCGRGTPGLFASHATTLVVVEALVLAIAATDQRGAEASLVRLNELRAALVGRRIDVDTP